MTVVMIHGFTPAAEAFHLQVDYLRGHGASKCGAVGGMQHRYGR